MVFGLYVLEVFQVFDLYLWLDVVDVVLLGMGKFEDVYVECIEVVVQQVLVLGVVFFGEVQFQVDFGCVVVVVSYLVCYCVDVVV